jgi:hypothetical protein
MGPCMDRKPSPRTRSKEPFATIAMPTTLRHAVHRIATLPPAQLIAVATLADLLAGALYWLYTQDVLESRFFRLGRDRGCAEIVQYLKLGLVLYMLAALHPARGSPLIRAWIILFVAILLDDSLGIHEAFGELFWIVIGSGEPVTQRAKDLAEAGGFALLEGSICLYILWRHVHAPANQRASSLWMMAGLVPLVFFGMVLDIAHSPLTEQIGEMAGMSLVLLTVRLQAPGRPDPPPPPTPEPGERPGLDG